MEFSLFSVLDLLGALAFAISGASLAIEKKFDLFGVFVLAFVTSIGGGTVRDILIGQTPVDWMSNGPLISTIAAGALLTLLFNPYVQKLRFIVYLFDAIGLGLFTMAGIQKGLSLDMNIFICISLGTISATFGGLLRDIITGEKPMLLTRKEIYAIASAIGGGSFFAFRYFELPMEINVPMTILIVFLVRHITYKMGIRLPGVDENGKWVRNNVDPKS
ncbi:MAG: trimeric intracellular cation channel family protein [Flavobacteriales bacterium]|nr:trimeric intracellular cation channel family protein [Flavobacteriales bacterium]